MFLTLVSALLLGIPASAQDTLVSVEAGDRLVLDQFSGYLEVRGWGRDEMEVRSDRGEGARLEVRRSGNRLELHVVDRKGRDRDGDLYLQVPVWMEVDISGRDLEVDIRDLEGKVTARNLDGDLSFRNLSGILDATSVQGAIEARELRGISRLRTGHDDIELNGASGELILETISGDLDLRNLAPTRMEIRTTDGDVDFHGRLARDGDYAIRSHDGDLTLTLEEPVHLDVSVLVYDGEFHSDFTVRAEGFQSGQELRFRIGDGGGRLVMETFDGDIDIQSEG